MARSIAKIKEQIAKLQREADSIQSTVIARIRKEIAQFDLTVENLFGAVTGAGEQKASTTRRSPFTFDSCLALHELRPGRRLSVCRREELPRRTVRGRRFGAPSPDAYLRNDT